MICFSTNDIFNANGTPFKKGKMNLSVLFCFVLFVYQWIETEKRGEAPINRQYEF